MLPAAFSDCALIWRDSNELNHNQMLSLLLAQAVQRFREVQLSRTSIRLLSLLLAQAVKRFRDVRMNMNDVRMK